MGLSAGAKIGIYEVLSSLGSGGMGEVYRARDSRLNRDVALKVLPEALARDPERVSRFKREAQVLAALNHPHIASIYGLEELNGMIALVLEVAEGIPLASLISKGAVSLEDALPLAKQITEALEYAHERGIIHRDLKPGNIQVASDGNVKILDFGLAKVLENPSETEASGASPTLTLAATRAGVIMGTPAYLSPEQARGRTLDKRIDIWAFGCVFYELLTGKRAFYAETVSDVIAAILTSEPEWEALPGTLPANLRVILHRCLQKDPARRLRDIGDVRIEFEEAMSGGLRSQMTSAIALTTDGLKRPSSSTTSRAVTRFHMTLPPGESLSLRVGTSVAISQDGKHVVFVANRGGRNQLYLRPMDKLEAVPLPGTECAEGPFFSPDGKWIGFFADHRLKKVAIQGGTPLVLCSAPVALGASWGPGDKIIFCSSPDAGLLQISSAGGTPEILTISDSTHGESGHYWPQILPGGKVVIYTVVMSTGSPRIAALRLDTGESHTLVEGGMNPHYAQPGYLVFSWGPSLLAAPFDITDLRLTAPATPILQGVLGTVFAGAQFSFSRDGALVYMHGELQAMNRNMVWVDRQGVSKPLGAPLRPYMDPKISPDGREVIATIHDGTKEDVWIYELERGTLARLTYEGFENETPLWMPSGEKVVLSSSRVGPAMSVFKRSKDGSGSEECLFPNDHHLHLNSISPDGRYLAFTDYHPLRGGDIWLAELEGGSSRRPLLQRPFNEWGAQFSPNGRWLAYVSNESGRDEIYVLAFPNLDRKWQISTEGGTEPLWARSGKEIFYRDGNRMMAAAVATEPNFSAGRPVLLFEGEYDRGLTLGHTNYDVAPDAQHFLMLKTSDQETVPTQLTVVLNWFDELDWLQQLREGAS